MARIDAFFRLMNSQGASGLHMVAGVAPCLRVQGDLEPVNYKELDSDEMLEQITPPARFKEFAVHAEPPGPRSEAPE
jgi:twitching motility protein PilT